MSAVKLNSRITRVTCSSPHLVKLSTVRANTCKCFDDGCESRNGKVSRSLPMECGCFQHSFIDDRQCARWCNRRHSEHWNLATEKPSEHRPLFFLFWVSNSARWYSPGAWTYLSEDSCERVWYPRNSCGAPTKGHSEPASKAQRLRYYTHWTEMWHSEATSCLLLEAIWRVLDLAKSGACEPRLFVGIVCVRG